MSDIFGFFIEIVSGFVGAYIVEFIYKCLILLRNLVTQELYFLYDKIQWLFYNQT